MVKLIVGFISSIAIIFVTLPLMANELNLAYKSICFDREIDGKFCCVAKTEINIKVLCMNYDNTLDRFFEYSGTLDDAMNMLRYPNSFPHCRTTAVHQYPQGYPCVDPDGNFNVGGKVMSPAQYFDSLNKKSGTKK